MEPNESVHVFVEDTLKRKLSTVIEDRAAFESWISRLIAEPEGLRLATCLAFDLHLERVASKLIPAIAEVFGSMTQYLSEEPVLAFARAVELTNRRKDLLTSVMVTHAGEETQASYVRVLRLQAFITCYVGHTAYDYTLDAADINEVRKLYFSGPASLEDVTQPWSGRHNIVWICSFHEFQDVLESAKDPASFLNDALGLGFTLDPLGAVPELVAITYPPGHPAESYQPRSLHADWDSTNFFVPHWDEDGWGRTHSCSGARGPLKERVHKAYQTGLSAEYHGRYLGPVASLVPDRDALYKATTSQFLTLYNAAGDEP